MQGYEYASPRTIGGGAGTYTVSSPWGPTPFEYAVRVISANGAGGVAITADGTSPAIAATTVTNTQEGATAEYIFVGAAGNITPSALFAACPSGRLTVTISGASNILLTIHMRRILQFAHMPDVYHINPDTTPEEAIHAQRAIDATKGS